MLDVHACVHGDLKKENFVSFVFIHVICVIIRRGYMQ